MFSIRRGLPVVLAAAVFAPAAAAQLPMESMPPPGPPPLTAPARDERPVLPGDLRRLAQAPQPGADGFEPISELPPDERLPAAPMLVAAYVFVTLALFLYLFSLSRRLGAVKQEIARLESDVKRSGRP
jgi:CcmD family protein